MQKLKTENSFTLHSPLFFTLAKLSFTLRWTIHSVK